MKVGRGREREGGGKLKGREASDVEKGEAQEKRLDAKEDGLLDACYAIDYAL